MFMRRKGGEDAKGERERETPLRSKLGFAYPESTDDDDEGERRRRRKQSLFFQFGGLLAFLLLLGMERGEEGDYDGI